MVVEAEFHPLQVEAWRRMTPAEKWTVARRATEMLREAARRRIAREHPEWSEGEVDQETARFLSRART